MRNEMHGLALPSPKSEPGEGLIVMALTQLTCETSADLVVCC
jgi:hypothetical protein